VITRLKSLPLLLAFSIHTHLCVAADDKEQRSNPIIISSVDILKHAPDLYLKACKTENKLEQIKLFDNLVQLMDLIIPTDNSEKATESVRVCQQLKALCLQQHSTALYNLTVKQDILNLSDLQKSADLLVQSSAISTELNDLKHLQEAQKNLGRILKELALAQATSAEKEEDFHKSLNLFDQSITNIHKSGTILSRDHTQEYLSNILSLSLPKAIQFYNDIHLQIIELYQQPHKSNLHYKKITSLIESVRHLLDFIDKHYIHSPEIDFYLFPSSPLTSKKETGKKKNNKKTFPPFPPSSAKVPPILTPPDFKRIILTVYCGLHKEASTTLKSVANSVSTQQLKDLYLHKGEDHLATAIDLYKLNIYQNNYENKPKEEHLYILACLEDITGNPTPLLDFYRQLHKQRKEEHHERWLAHIKSQLQTKKEKEVKTQQGHEKTPQISEESTHPIDKKTPSETSSFTPYPSFNTETSSKDTYEVIMPKEKIKTRGVAYPPSLGVEKARLSSQKEEEPLEEIKLSKDNYAVFGSLTGRNMDRNISLHEVEILLASLHCILTSGGKGVHQKATALNGQIWIRPKPWKGPIPDYYRLQLNDFLQNKMGIDPELISIGK
jgi:hypothetical protein